MKAPKAFREELKIIGYFFRAHKKATFAVFLTMIAASFLESLNLAALYPIINHGLNLGNESKDFYFKSDLTGNLTKAFVGTGKIDSEGKDIRGTGRLDDLDLYSDDVKTRFQHELDFWLKGAYRKKKPSASATKLSESATPAQKKK